MQGSSFIKAWISCLFELFLENKASVSFTYQVSESPHYNATQQRFGECRLHTFPNKNIIYTSINAQNHY